MSSRKGSSPTGSVWMDQGLVCELVRLWKAGFSASVVARHLRFMSGHDITRSSVIGKVHRLELEMIDRPRQKAPKRAAFGRRADNDNAKAMASAADHGRARPPAPPRLPATPIDPAYIDPRDTGVPDDMRRGVGDMLDDQCRWPIGDPHEKGFHFCHIAKVQGSSYCEAHLARAFASPVVKDRLTQRKSSGRDAYEIVANVRILEGVE